MLDNAEPLNRARGGGGGALLAAVRGRISPDIGGFIRDRTGLGRIGQAGVQQQKTTASACLNETFYFRINRLRYVYHDQWEPRMSLDSSSYFPTLLNLR